MEAEEQNPKRAIKRVRKEPAQRFAGWVPLFGLNLCQPADRSLSVSKYGLKQQMQDRE
jgi:hypothetical protein